MPQNERTLKRHKSPYAPRNEARRVVSSRATCRNRSTVAEGTRRSGQAPATIHCMRDWTLAFLRVSVEFDLHGIGIDIIKKNLNVKLISLALLLDGRGAESQR